MLPASFERPHRGVARLLVAAIVGACSPKESARPQPDAAASAVVSAPGGGDEIRAAYPLVVQTDPLAQRYCEATLDLPEKRRAACCGAATRGSSITGECTRTLSFALEVRAVTLAQADVDRCAEAVAKAHEGCGWVGPNPDRVPDACLGIIKGAVAEGGVCRSSLDCASGMHCHGAGPTNLGRCGPPRGARFACDLAIDTLAALARQLGYVEAQHPECAGYCAQHRCFDASKLGGPCKVTPECGPLRVCAAGKCSDAPLPAVGQPCPGEVCAGDARCLAGRCVAPKPEGEACAIDAECRAGCVRPDGGVKGTCGKRCGP